MPNPLFTHRCARCLLPFTQPSYTGHCPHCNGAVLPHVEACSAYRAANPTMLLGHNFDPYDGPGTVPLPADAVVIPFTEYPLPTDPLDKALATVRGYMLTPEEREHALERTFKVPGDFLMTNDFNPRRLYGKVDMNDEPHPPGGTTLLEALFGRVVPPGDNDET